MLRNKPLLTPSCCGCCCGGCCGGCGGGGGGCCGGCWEVEVEGGATTSAGRYGVHQQSALAPGRKGSGAPWGRGPAGAVRGGVVVVVMGTRNAGRTPACEVDSRSRGEDACMCVCVCVCVHQHTHTQSGRGPGPRWEGTEMRKWRGGRRGENWVVDTNILYVCVNVRACVRVCVCAGRV